MSAQPSDRASSRSRTSRCSIRLTPSALKSFWYSSQTSSGDSVATVATTSLPEPTRRLTSFRILFSPSLSSCPPMTIRVLSPFFFLALFFSAMAPSLLGLPARPSCLVLAAPENACSRRETLLFRRSCRPARGAGPSRSHGRSPANPGGRRARRRRNPGASRPLPASLRTRAALAVTEGSRRSNGKPPRTACRTFRQSSSGALLSASDDRVSRREVSPLLQKVPDAPPELLLDGVHVDSRSRAATGRPPRR